MAMAQEVSTESLDSIINALELKEVIVTAKKIRQSGDTISYSAATYRGKNDKTLEDLSHSHCVVHMTVCGPGRAGV